MFQLLVLVDTSSVEEEDRAERCEDGEAGEGDWKGCGGGW